MSHFTVMVIGENPEALLQPFHEYECTGIEDEFVVFVPADENIEEEYKEHEDDYESVEQFAADWFGYEKNDDGVWGRMTNPNAKWDWYQLGGRWSGDLIRLKEGVEGFEGEPSWGNPTSFGVDAAFKGDIDFDGIKNEAEKNGRARYKEVMKVFNGKLPVLDHVWYEMIDDKNEKYNKLDISEKRDMYHNQSAIKLINENHEVLGHFFEISDFDCTEDEYAERKRKDAFSTFAVIKNGKWYERGEMGWWACISNEKEQNDWNKEQGDLLEDVSDDTLISIYDCHI